MTVYISRKANLKFNIKAYYEDVRNFMLGVIIALAVIALGLFIACMALESQFKRVNIEAGEYFSAEDIFGDGSRFNSDFDPDFVNHAGVYYFTASTPKGVKTVRLSVKDTQAPLVTVKDVYFAVGGNFPDPKEFIDTVYEPDDFTGEYLNDLPEMTTLGSHEMQIRFTDASGNKSEIFTVKMTQIYDNKAPDVEVSPLIVCEVGGSIEYKPYITLSDNCIGELTFDVDESALDLSKVGEYTVYIMGRDGVGNQSEKIAVTVNVIETYNKDRLDEMLDDIIDDISPEEKTKEQICREIYKEVRRLLIYTGDSQKGDIEAAAYHALVGGGGDCYSYFAVSKLLLEGCGIETRDVERIPSPSGDMHYWNIVNIGDEGTDRWYHFDATELRVDRYDHSGCLLTEKQIEAYSSVRKDFYRYDRDLYPKAEEKIITPTPRLEEFYK